MKFSAAVAMKVLLVFSLLAIGSSAVWAGPLCANDPNGGSPVVVSGLLQLGDVGCIQQDKIWSSFTTGTGGAKSIPSIWNVSFGLVSQGGQDIHTMILSDPTSDINLLTALNNGTYTFNFRIAIDPLDPFYAQKNITNVQVSDILTTFPPPPPHNNTDTKVLVNGGSTWTVTSTNGLVANMNIPGVKFLNVSETIVVDSSSWITSISDVFTETTVPEPATTALMGVGLLALGGLLRRKKLAK